MPPIALPLATFKQFGAQWTQGGQRFTKQQAMDFGKLLDAAVGDALAAMLGGIPIAVPTQKPVS